jgi:hypothetical protein
VLLFGVRIRIYILSHMLPVSPPPCPLLVCLPCPSRVYIFIIVFCYQIHQRVVGKRVEKLSGDEQFTFIYNTSPVRIHFRIFYTYKYVFLCYICRILRDEHLFNKSRKS